jgi:hypothetical protein
MIKRYGFFFRKTIVQEDSDFVNNILEIKSPSLELTQDVIDKELETFAKPVINNTAYVYAIDIKDTNDGSTDLPKTVNLISRDSNGKNTKLFETATVVIKDLNENKND